MVALANWARLSAAGRTVFGTVEGDQLVVHEGDMFGRATPTGEIVPVADAVWRTPCQPSKFVALWNNLSAAAERNGWSRPESPLYFIKTPNAYNAHDRPIPPPPANAGRVVYEGELGVVVGARVKSATLAEAAAAIFGYTCVNDVTAFELIHEDASFEQWTRAKSFDGFAPFGPVIATGVQAAGLIVRTLLNGRERQNYPVADMFFSPAEIVSRISQDMTLEPGDLIACGTTTVGIAPMRAGAVVEVAIDGVGVLRNVFGVAEEDGS
jgi:2-keto-4-pentenoate hydratase/2-oxohepta-3-ene-1,7-dioic acid hydratase in catechol pathway